MSKLLILALILIGCGSIGGILLAINQFMVSNGLIEDVKDSKDSIISNLRVKNKALIDTINLKNGELKKNQKKIESLGISVLSFSKNIHKISKNTKEISVIIQNEQKERGSIGFEIKEDKYNFRMGVVDHFFTVNKFTDKKRYYYRGFLLEVSKKDNKLLLTTEYTKSYRGDFIFEMTNGDYLFDKNKVFSINYDSQGLEIIDNRGYVIFQVDFIGNVCTISGTHYYDNRYVFLRRNKNSLIINSDDSEFFEKQEYYSVKRIFEHTGENYLGKRTKSYLNEREAIIQQRSKLEKELKNIEEMTSEELIANGLDLVKKFKNLKLRFGKLTSESKEWKKFEAAEEEFLNEFHDKGLYKKITTIIEILAKRLNLPVDENFTSYKNRAVTGVINPESIEDQANRIESVLLIMKTILQAYNSGTH